MHEENPNLNKTSAKEAHTPSKSITKQKREKEIVTTGPSKKKKALQIEEDEEESLPANTPLGRCDSLDRSASKSIVLESILNCPPNKRMPTTRVTGMPFFLSISLCFYCH